MSNKLEQFIRDNREDFDSEEPGKRVWENITYPDGPVIRQRTGIIRLNAARWSAAAAIVLLIAGATWYFARPQKTNMNNQMAMNNPVDTPSKKPAPPVDSNTVRPIPSFRDLDAPVASAKTNGKKDLRTDATTGAENDYREEMYHYARLVEIKHKELKHIEKDEPLLYQQFAGDVNKLDSVYHSLEKKLPTNSNREQLLEAMLQNLQLQMDLLNHQLKIIRQINHTKKTAYENAYKTT